jgi:TrmH family RNA methyltransferase
MEIIRSRQNPFVKQLIKLATQRRERLKLQQTLLIGAHLVQAAEASGWPLLKLLVCEGEETRPELLQILTGSRTPALLLARELFSEIEQAPSTAGLMALVNVPEAPTPRREGFCLLLEDIQDPGNVGSILRTAAGAGVDQIWLTPGCADVWSPKVLRAGMGAHFLMPVVERVALDQALPAFGGKIAATTLENATSLYDCDLRGDLVLALGNEGSGVSGGLLAQAALRIHIPMQRPLESLNVAAAAAICAFERLRQRCA